MGEGTVVNHIWDKQEEHAVVTMPGDGSELIQQTTTHTEVPSSHEGVWQHDIIHIIGDNIGWSPLLLIILLGSKKIRNKLLGISKKVIKRKVKGK